MTRIHRLFLLLALIGPIHMAEQLFTSIEEFHMLRGQLGRYYAWVTWTDPDRATVVLITLVGTSLTLLCYALLVGGVPRLVAAGVFGLLGSQEIHHVFEAVGKGGYDAGVITCIPYCIVGNLLLNAVWTEFKRGRTLADAHTTTNTQIAGIGRQGAHS